MKIYDKTPGNWVELEKMVTDVVSSAGYEAFRQKRLETVRGSVNIDVLVKDHFSIPKLTYLIECKYWDNNIPQSVVHGFRTVVNDFGASHGFIIAKKNFQSGSIEATFNTNIRLLNWYEFLDLFESRWIKFSLKRLSTIAQPLLDYTDVLNDKINIPSENKETFQELCIKYGGIAVYSYAFLYEPPEDISLKEHIVSVIKKATNSILIGEKINCYSEYFSVLENKCKEGIDLFEHILNDKQNGRK